MRGQVSANSGDFSLAADPKCNMDGKWIMGFLTGGQYFGDGDVIEIDPEKAHLFNIGWIINCVTMDLAWDGCATVYDITHDKKVDFERSDAGGKQGEGWESLELDAITEPTTLRINIMANHDYRAPEPDVSLQKQRK